jgi:hypothetical protein
MKVKKKKKKKKKKNNVQQNTHCCLALAARGGGLFLFLFARRNGLFRGEGDGRCALACTLGLLLALGDSCAAALNLRALALPLLPVPGLDQRHPLRTFRTLPRNHRSTLGISLGHGTARRIRI